MPHGHRQEIGEGRSKSIYIEPTVTDTAVLLAFYNPVPFKRILRNMLYIIQCLKEKNIPYFVIECVFKHAEPQIPHATLVVRSNSYMFYKEQLLNKLEKVVPEKYTKLVCMDGDIMFDTPDWVDQVSVSLDKHDIIQPFAQACWLTPDNTKIRSKKPSYAVGIVEDRLKSPRSIHLFHPGFAWAFKRDVFHKIGGFFDRAVVGNGDMLFVFNFFKDAVPDFWIRDVLQTKFILDTWPAYHAKIKEVNPKIGFLTNKALHLFHGVRQNRQYTTRYKSVSHMLTGTWDEQIIVNADGLFEFKNPELSNGVLEYFKRRNEDIPLEEAEKIAAQPLPTRRVRRRSVGHKHPIIFHRGTRKFRVSI
jgi:hypothetical protein